MFTPFECVVFALQQDWDLQFRIDSPVRSLKDLRDALKGYAECFELTRKASESDALLQQIVDKHDGHRTAWEDDPNGPDFPASR